MTRLDAAKLNPAQLRAWRNALFVIFAMSGAAVATWISRLPEIRDQLGASTFAMGLFLLGMASASISGTLAASAAVRRWGPGPVIRASQTSAAAGLVIIGAGAASSSYVLVPAGYMILGFGLGTCDVAMNVDAARNEQLQKKPQMSLFHASYSCGTILGAALGALSQYLGVPVLAHCAIAGAVVAGAALVAVRQLPAAQPVQPAAAGAGGAVRPWRSRRILLVGLFVLSMALSEGAASDWLGLAMADGYGTSNTVAALVFGLFVTTMTVGRFTGVYLLRRWGRVPVLRGSVLLTAAGLVLVIVSPAPWLASVGAGLWGLGTAVGFPTGISAAADDPVSAPANVSAVSATGYIAFLAGPPVIGTLGQHTGLLPALWVVLAVVLAGGAVAGAAREQHTPHLLGGISDPETSARPG